MSDMTAAQAAQQNNRGTGGRYATKELDESEAGLGAGSVAVDGHGVAIIAAGVDDHRACPAVRGMRCDEHGFDAESHVGDMEILACTDDGEDVTSGVAEADAQFWTLYSRDSDSRWMAAEDYDSRDEARAVLAVSKPHVVDAAAASYEETLMWSSVVVDSDGEIISADDFEAAPELSAECREEIDGFLVENANLFARAQEVMPDYTVANFAADFALTRNGHGAGFWDRGLGDVGVELTKAAKAHGSTDLYLDPVTKTVHQG